VRRFVLSSAVISTPGHYAYALLSAAQAATWLARGEAVSCVGYDVTADAMGTLLGVRPDVLRRHVQMECGDEALVFRLKMRIGPHLKYLLTKEFVAANAEIGLLRRLAEPTTKG